VYRRALSANGGQLGYYLSKLVGAPKMSCGDYGDAFWAKFGMISRAFFTVKVSK